jgi:hypothetical protein
VEVVGWDREICVLVEVVVVVLAKAMFGRTKVRVASRWSVKPRKCPSPSAIFHAEGVPVSHVASGCVVHDGDEEVEGFQEDAEDVDVYCWLLASGDFHLLVDEDANLGVRDAVCFW